MEGDTPKETQLFILGEKGRSQLQRDMRASICATVTGARGGDAAVCHLVFLLMLCGSRGHARRASLPPSCVPLCLCARQGGGRTRLAPHPSAPPSPLPHTLPPLPRTLPHAHAETQKVRITYAEACAIAEEVLHTEYDTARIIFNRFVTAISYKPTLATVLSPDVSERGGVCERGVWACV